MSQKTETRRRRQSFRRGISPTSVLCESSLAELVGARARTGAGEVAAASTKLTLESLSRRVSVYDAAAAAAAGCGGSQLSESCRKLS